MFPFTESFETFSSLKDVYLSDQNGKQKRYRVSKVEKQKKLIIFDFQEIDSLNDAEKLVGLSVSAKRSNFKPLPEGEYYYFELIGLSVFTEEGRLLGEIKSIFPTGSNDVYVIAGQDKEYLVPATAEVVTQIDLKNMRVVIRPLEGLFEDDAI